jgi:hypothetical protein
VHLREARLELAHLLRHLGQLLLRELREGRLRLPDVDDDQVAVVLAP